MYAERSVTFDRPEAAAVFTAYVSTFELSETDSQIATTINNAVVAIDSTNGDMSAANQPSTRNAAIPTMCESWKKFRIACLNRIVPTRNSKGPPTAQKTVR